MSATTADSLLRSSRQEGPRGVSTTRAGTQLKNQIPIRTFQDWNKTEPGSLEADLVVHSGWTECLLLLYRSRETVLAVIQHARTLFPFPILGIDTENGGEVHRRGTGGIV